MAYLAYRLREATAYENVWFTLYVFRLQHIYAFVLLQVRRVRRVILGNDHNCQQELMPKERG